MEIVNFTFLNTRNIELAGRIYKNNNSLSGVIFSHGLFSNKDGYKITNMAETIVNLGFNLMTFDFTFSGESPGSIKDISIEEEVDDLKSAINYFKETGIKKIHLMGSSMGAAISILTASLNIFQIESIILIATPLSFKKIIPEFTENDINSLNLDGFTSIDGVLVNNRFIKDIFNINMIDAVKKINIPSLLIHGQNDNIVDIENLYLYIQNCPSDCSYFIIEDGDHNLARESDILKISEKVKGWLSTI
ncbi:MAG: alpha/beta hydrolase [Leptospirales bacterium]|nr:alpha/beta hydrolase [Leptospirales bacterium]